MSEDILLKDEGEAEFDEANQASSSAVDSQSIIQDPSLYSVVDDTYNTAQETLATPHPHADRVQPLEGFQHTGSTWPKDSIIPFRNLPADQQEQLRGTSGEHFSDVSPLDFDPLHEAHPDIGIAPMWCRLLESFFLDGVSQKDAERELAFDKEYEGEKHITLPSAFGKLDAQHTSDAIYERNYQIWLRETYLNPDSNQYSEKLASDPDGFEKVKEDFDEQLRRSHMDIAMHNWMSDEIDPESGRRLGLGEEDYINGMEWLTPAQRVQVYQHINDNDVNLPEHQAIPGLSGFSMGRVKRSRVQRGSSIHNHWIGHPNYAANSIPSRLIKDRNTAYTGEHFYETLERNDFELLRKLKNHSYTTGQLVQPFGNGYDLPSARGLRQKSGAPQERLLENDLYMAAGIDPQSVKGGGDWKFYEAGQHPLYGKAWFPNSVQWTPEDIKGYMVKFNQDRASYAKDHGARNAFAFHAQPYVAVEGEGAHPEEYTMNDTKSLNHHWARAHMRTGGMSKAFESRQDITDKSIRYGEGDVNYLFQSYELPTEEPLPQSKVLEEETPSQKLSRLNPKGDKFAGQSKDGTQAPVSPTPTPEQQATTEFLGQAQISHRAARSSSMHMGTNYDDPRTSFSRLSENAKSTAEFTGLTDISSALARNQVFHSSGFGNHHTTSMMHTPFAPYVSEGHRRHHTLMSMTAGRKVGNRDERKEINNAFFNNDFGTVHTPHMPHLGRSRATSASGKGDERLDRRYDEGKSIALHTIGTMIGAGHSARNPQDVRAYNPLEIPETVNGKDIPANQFTTSNRLEFNRIQGKEGRPEGYTPPDFFSSGHVDEEADGYAEVLSKISSGDWLEPFSMLMEKYPNEQFVPVITALQNLKGNRQLSPEYKEKLISNVTDNIKSLIENKHAELTQDPIDKESPEQQRRNELARLADKRLKEAMKRNSGNEEKDALDQQESLQHDYDSIMHELMSKREEASELEDRGGLDEVQREQLEHTHDRIHSLEQEIDDIESKLDHPDLDPEKRTLPAGTSGSDTRKKIRASRHQELVNSHIEGAEKGASMVLQEALEQGFDIFEMFKDEFGNPRPDTAVAWLLMQGTKMANLLPHENHGIEALVPAEIDAERRINGDKYTKMLSQLIQWENGPDGNPRMSKRTIVIDPDEDFIDNTPWLEHYNLQESVENDQGIMVLQNKVDDHVIDHMKKVKTQLKTRNKSENKPGRKFIISPASEIVRRITGVRNLGEIEPYLKDDLSFYRTGTMAFKGKNSNASDPRQIHLGEEHRWGPNMKLHGRLEDDEGFVKRHERKKVIHDALKEFKLMTRDSQAMEAHGMMLHPLPKNSHSSHYGRIKAAHSEKKRNNQPVEDLPSTMESSRKSDDRHIKLNMAPLSSVVSVPIGEFQGSTDTVTEKEHVLEKQPVGQVGNSDTNGLFSIYDSPSLRYNFGSNDHTVPLGLHIDEKTGTMEFYKKSKPESMPLISPTRPSVEALVPPHLLHHFGPNHESSHTEDSMPHYFKANSRRQSPNMQPGSIRLMDGPSLLASLTNPDVIRKDMPEGVPSLQPMHRIFELSDLEHLRGFTGDWIVSAYPEGERFFVGHKEGKIFSKATLSDEEKDAFKKVSDKQYIVDVIRGKDVLHIFDVVEYDDEKAYEMVVQERIKILRGAMESYEMVHVPSASDTKLTDDDGLASAVKALDTDRILLRDAQSAYMKGEPRHPKWVMLQSGSEVVLMVLDRRGDGPYTYRLGTGPVAYGEDLGDRRVKYEDEDYMDVGAAFQSEQEYNVGDLVKVDVTNVTETQASEQQKLYTVHASKIEGEAEGEPLVSSDSLGILAKSEPYQHGVEIFRKGHLVRIEMNEGSVLYKATQTQVGWAVHTPRSDNSYLIRLSESQRPFWSPIVGILLKANMGIEEKAEVHESKDEAEPLIEPKKVKDTDWKKKAVMAKGLEVAMRLLAKSSAGAVSGDNSGAKGLAFDYGSGLQSPGGPTNLDDSNTMPDYDVRDVERDKKDEAEDKREVDKNNALSSDLELTEDKAVYHVS